MVAGRAEWLSPCFRRHGSEHLCPHQGLLPTKCDAANDKLGKLPSNQLGNLVGIKRSALAQVVANDKELQGIWKVQ